jgi:hypothetical protein
MTKSKVVKARATRHGVVANGKFFSSTLQAFKALNLPLGSHARFRKYLKEAKRAKLEIGSKKISFRLADPRN